MLVVPDNLKRGGGKNASSPELGLEGLEIVARALGGDVSYFDGKSMLDVGCGNKLAEAIVKYDLPFERYVGVDNAKELMELLAPQAEGTCLEFHHVAVYNERYFKDGRRLTRDFALPVQGLFDVIHAFSLFSHLDATDTDAYFHVLRRHAHADTEFIFTAFLADVPTWLDSEPENALLRVRYGPAYMDGLLETAGWRVDRAFLRDPELETPWEVRPMSDVTPPRGGQSFIIARPR